MKDRKFIEQELDNLEQKMEYAETKQDLLYILSRVEEVISDDEKFGSYIRSFIQKHFNIKQLHRSGEKD
jgi:hypothetical protein